MVSLLLHYVFLYSYFSFLLSSLRAQLVSDRWLAELGETIDIETCLILGAKALGDAAARTTIRADATEALIGALYKVSGSLEPILDWLTPHWQRTSADVLAAPHRFNGKTTLQEWSQGQGLGLPEYSTEERSQVHGDPQRFRSTVRVAKKVKYKSTYEKQQTRKKK